METFAQKVYIVLLDKGLLALLIAIAVWILNRSVERLRNSLSWRNEILKEKLSQAKSIRQSSHSTRP